MGAGARRAGRSRRVRRSARSPAGCVRGSGCRCRRSPPRRCRGRPRSASRRRAAAGSGTSASTAARTWWRARPWSRARARRCRRLRGRGPVDPWWSDGAGRRPGGGLVAAAARGQHEDGSGDRRPEKSAAAPSHRPRVKELRRFGQPLRRLASASASRRDLLLQHRARRREVQPREARAGHAAGRSVGQRHPGVLEEELGRVVAEVEAPAVEPGEVGALGRGVADLREPARASRSASSRRLPSR